MKGATFFLLAAIASVCLSCEVRIDTYHTSSKCSGIYESKVIVADTGCRFDGNEWAVADLDQDAVTVTLYESATCSPDAVSAEPTKYRRDGCTELGGGMSAIASWGGSDCPQYVRSSGLAPDVADAIDAAVAIQAEPCYWSDFYKMRGQTYRQFTCTNVSDYSVVVFDSSSDTDHMYSMAIFSDAEFRAWTAGQKARCLNAECLRRDAKPKSDVLDVHELGAPYHIVIMNLEDASTESSFEATISVSVGKKPSAGVDGDVGLTGSPPPPPPPTPPPPHPPTPPPPHPPSPPPPTPPPPSPPGCNSTCASCYGDMCCQIPCNNQYVLTSFCNGESGPMACGGTCQQPKNQWFTADKQRYGCATALNVCANGKCIKGMALDAGPNANVEKSAGMPVLDAYAGFCQNLFGQSSCGWSDHHVVTVTKSSDDRPFGVFIPTPEEYQRIINGW